MVTVRYNGVAIRAEVAGEQPEVFRVVRSEAGEPLYVLVTLTMTVCQGEKETR